VTTLLFGIELLIRVLRVVLLAAAVAAAVAAGLSWAVRTRRLSPFGGVARVVRKRIDPLFAPMERRIVRAGGLPTHAPWWTLAAVIVSGIVLLSLLGFLGGQLAGASLALRSGGRGLYVLLVTWTLGLLQLALFARVISSWFRMSPYSPWIRWSFVLTEWFLAPLRRVIPSFGMIDLTPIAAYFGLQLLEAVLIRGIS
jgi:YggT family protein